MRPPKGTELTFEFFRDKNGRLRCKCQELGITKPVESADHQKRYKWAKVFGMFQWFSNEDHWKLQLAKAGDIIKVKVV